MPNKILLAAASPSSVTAFCVAFFLLWFAGVFVLWWAYDMSAFIAGDAYNSASALAWAWEFSLILSGLAAVVWLRGRKALRTRRGWQAAWAICWQTAILLLLYAIPVVAARQTWSPKRGISDWAMFLGPLNARFFSETGPITFMLEVVPSVAVISAVLFWMQLRFLTSRD